MAEVALRGLVRAAQGHRDVGGDGVDARHLASTSAAACSCARCTTGRRCCSSPRSACTCCASSSRARSASRASSTGSSASCSSSSRWPRASPATRSPTTCSRATACASSTAWSRASRSSAPGSPTCSSAASSPGTDIVGRFYSAAHPAAARRSSSPLIGVHLVLLVVNKHTQFAGPGRTNDNVVGVPIMPVFAAKAGGFFFIVFGVIVLIAAHVHDQPDLELRTLRPLPGLGGNPARLVHRLRRRRAAPRPAGLGVRASSGYTLSLNILIPLLVLPVFLVAGRALPLHRGVDHRRQARAPHRRPPAQRPDPHRDRRRRRHVLRGAVGGGELRPHRHPLPAHDRGRDPRAPGRCCSSARSSPTSSPSAICIGLQKKDREIALHGYESGRIVRLPGGEYIEVHEQLVDYERWKLVELRRLQAAHDPPEQAGPHHGRPSACARCSRAGSSRTASRRSRRPSSRPRTATTTSRRSTKRPASVPSVPRCGAAQRPDGCRATHGHRQCGGIASTAAAGTPPNRRPRRAGRSGRSALACPLTSMPVTRPRRRDELRAIPKCTRRHALSIASRRRDQKKRRMYSALSWKPSRS